MDSDRGQYRDIPQPDQIPIRDREDAMGAYMMMFAALAAGLPLPIINLIASVVYYFVHRSKSPFIRFHLIQSLYSQIITSMMNVVLVFWTLRIFLFKTILITDYYKGYLITVVLANLLYIAFSIVAAVRARQGRFYYFLFFGKIAYHRAFLLRDAHRPPVINQPPF